VGRRRRPRPREPARPARRLAAQRAGARGVRALAREDGRLRRAAQRVPPQAAPRLRPERVRARAPRRVARPGGAADPRRPAVGDLAHASPRARLGAWLRNELALEAYELSPAKMDAYVARLNAFRPRLLLAYAQSAFELARHAESRGLEVLPIPAVMTSATNLE